MGGQLEAVTLGKEAPESATAKSPRRGKAKKVKCPENHVVEKEDSRKQWAWAKRIVFEFSPSVPTHIFISCL